ncbi:MAG: hypothetical protein ABIA74_04760 [bacterium]
MFSILKIQINNFIKKINLNFFNKNQSNNSKIKGDNNNVTQITSTNHEGVQLFIKFKSDLEKMHLNVIIGPKGEIINEENLHNLQDSARNLRIWLETNEIDTDCLDFVKLILSISEKNAESTGSRVVEILTLTDPKFRNNRKMENQIIAKLQNKFKQNFISPLQN